MEKQQSIESSLHFENLIALDIGGTLAKLAFTLPKGSPEISMQNEDEKQPDSYSKCIFNRTII